MPDCSPMAVRIVLGGSLMVIGVIWMTHGTNDRKGLYSGIIGLVVVVLAVLTAPARCY